MRILLMGDGAWAARTGEALVADGHTLVGVVLRTRPSDDALSAFASAHGLPVLQPARVNEPGSLAALAALEPELTLSFSYDQIMRADLIALAPRGTLNCHAGALPRYRGRNVLNWALINGEERIGLTVHHVDLGIDTGDIILQEPLSVAWEDTYGSLLAKVTAAFPPVVARAVGLVERGTATRTPQAHLPGTYFPARGPGDELLDWDESARNVYNKIRAITVPGPGARTSLEGAEVTVWAARYDPSWPAYIATPGAVVGAEPDGVRVKAGDATVVLTSVSMDGAPPVPPRWRVGTRLGH